MVQHIETATTVPATAVDPVCKMTVETSSALQATDHDGTVQYFCMASCRDTYCRMTGAVPAQFTRL